jgi:serine/threonine protein kinase
VASSVDGCPQDLSPDAYTVERELGRGGMATVYAVRDPKHGRRVAFMVLRAELAASLGAGRCRERHCGCAPTQSQRAGAAQRRAESEPLF